MRAIHWILIFAVILTLAFTFWLNTETSNNYIETKEECQQKFDRREKIKNWDKCQIFYNIQIRNSKNPEELEKQIYIQ